MIVETAFLAVRGIVHLGTILEVPSRLMWVRVITSFFAPDARSMAPPTPSNGFPGMAQLARLPSSSTSDQPLFDWSGATRGTIHARF